MTPDPTTLQVDYVRSLQRRLRLPDRLLDKHCVTRFDSPFSALTRAQVSSLLDELIGWQDIPADMRRAQGQQDLPGFEP